MGLHNIDPVSEKSNMCRKWPPASMAWRFAAVAVVLYSSLTEFGD